MAKAKSKRSFEELMDELELLLQQMEQEDLDLDEMLKKYAAAVELAGACRERLGAAQLLLDATAAAVNGTEAEGED